LPRGTFFGGSGQLAPPTAAIGPQVDVPVATGSPFKPKRLSTPLDKIVRHAASGKRSFTRTTEKRGRYVTSRAAGEHPDDIALDATLRQAAPFQERRALDRQERGVALAIESGDLRRKVRVRRAANLILFVVDASWSMAAQARMVATKGAILSLLMDAYQQRDRVGLIVFQKEEARLILSPTGSVERAKKVLKDIPVGGKTPLSRGLFLAYQVLLRERRKNAEVMPLLILLTDGAGNVSMTNRPPQEEALEIARLLRHSGVHAVVVNAEHESLDRGLARGLADALGGTCYTLQELRAQDLYETVRETLRGVGI